MVKKSYLKSLGRLFIRHIVRLLSISAIFVVTVSLISGLGDVESNIKRSIKVSYQQDNIHDFVIRGYTPDLIKIKDALDDLEEIKTVEQFYTYDTPTEGTDKFASRAIFRDLINPSTDSIDKLELLEGKWPADQDEVLVERATTDFSQAKIGSTISIKILESETLSKKVVGIVKNPTMVALKNEPSDYYETKFNRYINQVTYLDTGAIDEIGPYSYQSALNITIKDRNTFNSFNEGYKNKIAVIKGKIETIARSLSLERPYSILTLSENFSLVSLDMYAEKVGVLATIFIVFFILIAILVVYSTMSRLLDEERGSMAVLKTLGYSNFAIAIRYVLFALTAGLIGIGLSVIPAKIVNSLILNAFGIQYAIKQIALPVVGPYFFMLAFTILLLSLILTLIKSVRTANHSPVELLTPRAPKVGKKIVLERIKAIWSRLSFKYKSTYRNVFLFKARFIMTVLSIMAATVLVFASFALLNNSVVMKGFETLRLISLLLLAFSAALCALVIYNITNINISERTREIATLMVLGYRNHEVTGYIYREIYILTAIGSILGLPAGIGFVIFVFDYIGVFELANVEWWTYLVSPIITFVFALLATRLLHMKIVKTDMNESLKVLE